MKQIETEVEKTYFAECEIHPEDRDSCELFFSLLNNRRLLHVPFGVEVRLADHPEYHAVKVVKRGTLYNKARVVFTLRDA